MAVDFPNLLSPFVDACRTSRHHFLPLSLLPPSHAFLRPLIGLMRWARRIKEYRRQSPVPLCQAIVHGKHRGEPFQLLSFLENPTCMTPLCKLRFPLGLNPLKIFCFKAASCLISLLNFGGCFSSHGLLLWVMRVSHA
jgi:hypothetical protein